MSAPRAVGGLLRQASRRTRLASQPSSFGAWRCPQCLRTFASSRPFGETSRRHLQTATAYQPSSLPSHPLPQPPRNTGIPDTSIAGGKPETNEQRPPRLTEQRGNDDSVSSADASSVSVTETEAQRSKSVSPNTSTSPAPPSSARPRRSKLRPRKAAMTLTPKAVHQLRELMDQPDPKLIRVGVKNRGCSGLAYHLEYVDKPGAFDEAVEQDGVKVLVDSKALFSIIGSEMDWLEDKLSARFIFKNPNISEQCGCGESFSVG